MGVVIPFPDPGSRQPRDPGEDPHARADDTPAWAVPGVDRVDDQVDADEPVSLPTKTSRRAENVSVAALTGRDTTEAELRTRLTRKGLESADVDTELQRLRAAGLIDDRAFADRMIQRLRERKGLGDGALRLELRQRRVPPDVVDAALAAATEQPETVQDRLQQVAEERARRLTTLPPEVAERRLLAYLQRRGYDGADARAAARAALHDR